VVWAVGVVALAALGYLASSGGDWRGALRLAGSVSEEAAITARIESELAWNEDDTNYAQTARLAFFAPVHVSSWSSIH